MLMRCYVFKTRQRQAILCTNPKSVAPLQFLQFVICSVRGVISLISSAHSIANEANISTKYK